MLLLALLPFIGWAQQNDALYRNGEVIVKFKTKDAITISNADQQSRRGMAVSANDRISNVMQQLGVREAESLMPLTSKVGSTGSLKAPAKHDLSALYLLRFDSTAVASMEDAVVALRQLDEVVYAEPNYIRHTFGTAADYTSASLYDSQWYLEAINMPYLWDQPIVNEKKPVIAILDTGVTFAHFNLRGQWWEEREPSDGKDNDGNGYVDDMYGWDFIHNTWDMYDGHGHGTHCAGIAAGKPNQGEGIVGANPDARLLDVKVMDDNGQGDDATLIKGINYAVAAGADILSMSLGGYAEAEGLRETLENASQHCIVVAAAGNEYACITEGHGTTHGVSSSAPSFPAAYPFVLAVQATDKRGELAEFSNFDCDGPYQSTYEENYNYDLRAPGVDMLSSYPTFGENLRGVGYKRMDGTSMACPLVAGAISRLMQCGKVTDFNSLRDLLIKTSGQTIDMKAAYDATTEMMNAETFQIDVNGVMMTFYKTSETTAQVGDGTIPAISTEVSGKIEIPNDVHGLLVTSVAANAFKGCNQLTDVILPWNVATIGSSAFNSCSLLTQLTLQSATAPTCETNSFDEATYTSCCIDVPYGCSDIYQADAVWGRFAANMSELLPIGGYGFKEIGDFSYTIMIISAKDKKAMLLSAEPKSMDGTDGILTVPERIGGYQVISVGYQAFAACDWLKQVILPDCITDFEEQCFCNNQNLETVNYPASLRKIGNFAFRDCTSFNNGHIPGNVKDIGEAFENTGIEELVLGEGVERVDIDAFTHCLKLKKIHIPSTLISIMESFHDLPNIEQIEVAEGNPFYDSRNNCNAIISTKENYLLLGCKNTVIPEGVTKIGGFWGTKGFTDLHLSKYIEFITDFRDCEDLENVTVDCYNQRYYSPKGSNVIMDNGNIEIICSNSVIPEEAQSISALSSYRNSHITSVTIPTAISIGGLVYAGCTITEVISLAKRPKYLPDYAFYDNFYSYYMTDHREEDKIFENATLYVPYGSKAVYEATPEWNRFSRIVELPAVVRGDTNNSGALDAADYTELVDHLLGKDVDGYHPTAADADEDGRVTARDLASLNDLLAGQLPETNDGESYDYLSLFATNMYPGTKNEIMVPIYSELKAIHARFRLPEGMTFADNPVTFNDALDGEYIKEYSIDENNLRIVICPALGHGENPLPITSGTSAFNLNVDVADNIAPNGYIETYFSLALYDGRLKEDRGGQLYKMGEPPVPQLIFAPGQQWQSFYSNSLGCAFEEGKGAKAYAITDIVGQNVIATAIDGGVPEGCMVLVGLDEMPTEEVTVGLTARKVSAPEKNYLNGQDYGVTVKPNSTYVLYNNEFVLNSGTSVPGGKGFLSANWVKNSSTAYQNLKIVIGGETTSVRKVDETTNKNAEWYDLQGRRLNTKPSTSGLYIRNHQKVVIK